MEFYERSCPEPARLGIFAGSFNPPTVAHRELVSAAGFHVDQVLCVVPRAFPHKDHSGATLEQRLEMLARSELTPPYSIAVSERGLFVDIATECRDILSPSTELHFICGADAAERILGWDYGRAGVVDEMLREFQLLVAPRSGRAFEAPPRYRDRIKNLHIHDAVHNVSSSEVRRRIRAAAPWEHLVPSSIVAQVRSIYS